jgi:diaminopimelate decarboxylase/aspartate kinase
VFGPSWEEVQPGATAGESEGGHPWWVGKREELLALMEDRDAAYVYDLETVRERLTGLTALEPVDRVLYAMKANNNPEVLRAAHDAGAGFECVSPGEVLRVRELFPHLDPARILFTPNFAGPDEYAFGLEQGVNTTLDSLFPVREWPQLFQGRDVFVRVDPGVGRGHHEKVQTAGAYSKFGVPLFELEELAARAKDAGARVVGLHAHSGSGILTPEHWESVGQLLAEVSELFPHVRVLDVGGGLGVPEKPTQKPLDLAAVAEGIRRVRDANPGKELWIEPGRYVVAEAGVLLARVTQIKGKGAIRYVGVATGMNSLIRPALYGAYHPIANLTRLGDPAVERVTVVGPICESGDRLGLDRLLPESHAGDVMLIGNAGAYGYVMGSRYNLREPAGEVVVG